MVWSLTWGRRQVALAAALLAVSLAGSLWWLAGADHWGQGGQGGAWLGAAEPGPEPGTLRLRARLGQDLADLYVPQAPAARPAAPLPVALVLPGANVDKGHYATFAALLAREGFVVVVPNHWRTFPPLPLLGRRMLLPDQRQISAILSPLRQLQPTAPPSVGGLFDPRHVVVVGHSMGGLAGLEALANRCRFPLCLGRFERPEALRGGVFVGTDLRGHGGGPVAPIDTDGLPVALISGSRDGASKPADVEETWRQLRTTRRQLLVIEGANHYALTNTSAPINPPGLPPVHPDPQVASADQRATLERIARWSGAFLREAVADRQPG